MKVIEAGTHIDIKRTDGRVHSAVVSGVNWSSRSVTVEWFEQGETKGKELPVDQILILNPDLCPEQYASNNTLNNATNNKARLTTAGARTTIAQLQPMNPPAPVGGSLRQPRNYGRPANLPAEPQVSVEREDIPPTPTSLQRNTYAPQGVVRTNAALASVAAQQQARASVVNQNNQTQSKAVLAAQKQQQQLQEQQARNNANNQQLENNTAGRRSNVVKEVEKLKKNREERRLRHAEIKEEKEALMNMDPGNPNWEFLAMIREYRGGIEFRPLRENDAAEDHQITVCVRKRPLNKKELSRKEVDVITVPRKDQIVVHEPKAKVDLTKYLENQQFRFDYAFDDTCTNDIVYRFTAKPLVQTIFEGGMATCFAYGQTGSGKTHTMGGDFQGKTQDCKKGIYALVAKDVFKLLESSKYRPLKLMIGASFFEIYSGKVFDLLADKAKLRVLEDGKQVVQIVGLTERVVENVDEVLRLIQHGNNARTSGQTSANSNSSRSHAVFQLTLRAAGSARIHGKFSLIDLAGNERGADTSSANRQTRMEGAEINKSLLALKECIRALGRKGAHLPFRASKLTQVLRDSFIGEKSRTCMIAMISPGMSSCEHSLNTLRYADRVKELAAADPTRTPEEEDADPLDQLNESDLAQLRSLNEGDMSADMYQFHEAVSKLQEKEEELLDSFKELIDLQARNLDLYNSSRQVDYDQEAFSLELESVINQQFEKLTRLREVNRAFRAQMTAEELVSQKVKPRARPN